MRSVDLTKQPVISKAKSMLSSDSIIPKDQSSRDRECFHSMKEKVN